jgi:hypothetical protein
VYPGWQNSPQALKLLVASIVRLRNGLLSSNQQSDRRDLARQRQAGHRRLRSSRHWGGIELLQGTWHDGRPDRCALEQVFQIVIVIPSAARDLSVY